MGAEIFQQFRNTFRIALFHYSSCQAGAVVDHYGADFLFYLWHSGGRHAEAAQAKA